MSRIESSNAQPARRWFVRVLSACVFALVSIALVRWRVTLTHLGEYLICSEAPESADLILILGGDFYGPRVLKAAELAQQGFAPTVLISSPPYRGRPEGEFAIAYLTGRGYSTAAFQIFAHNASSTVDEVIALRDELIRRSAKRVILVTSAYHSRRSAIVFRLFCPGIRFISVPAADEHFHAEDWWSDHSSRKLFFSEWKKIFGSLLYAYPSYLLGHKRGFAAKLPFSVTGRAWIPSGFHPRPS